MFILEDGKKRKEFFTSGHDQRIVVGVDQTWKLINKHDYLNILSNLMKGSSFILVNLQDRV